MQSNREPDCSGKVVFVGIDVHKKTYVIAATCEGVLVKKASVPASPDALLTTLLRAFPNSTIRTAYEAGFSGFGLHHFLKEKGIENMVVNPASILTRANDKVKTDSRVLTQSQLKLSQRALNFVG